ncbi:MAG: sigma-54-dependent Fis family transcriptional regulator, partial [Verrucomicrobia bacterium]
GMGGLDVVRRVHAACPTVPIVLMTAHGTTDTAIEAIKGGAYDFLLKPFEMDELLALVERAVDQGRQAAEALELGGTPSTPGTIVGKSRAMQSVYKEIGRVATKPVTVLIRGETGTGKELIARAIYQHSDRSRAAFVAVNCAAIPETLLESELFGHERGAFTGAVERRIGRFEQADGGTLFLDEIGEMGASTQAKLLRVLQERCIQRLGGRDTLPIDVRVIAATHVNLEDAIVSKRFREDLFYRLNQFTISLPPLRERPEDIVTLAPHFLRKHAESLGIPSPSVTAEAFDALKGYSWPGNIRELENVVRQALLLAGHHAVTPAHVQQVLAGVHRPGSPLGESFAQVVGDVLAGAQRGEIVDAYDVLLRRLERELFSQAIQLAGENQAKAARWLGISRVTMREKLRQYGLKESPEPPEMREPVGN